MPSQADIQITTRLKSALALVDVRVLDHIVVTVDDCVSLAQRGHLLMCCYKDLMKEGYLSRCIQFMPSPL